MQAFYTQDDGAHYRLDPGTTGGPEGRQMGGGAASSLCPAYKSGSR